MAWTALGLAIDTGLPGARVVAKQTNEELPRPFSAVCGKLSSDQPCVTTVGLDQAKRIFFAHAVDALRRASRGEALRRRMS